MVRNTCNRYFLSVFHHIACFIKDKKIVLYPPRLLTPKHSTKQEITLLYVCVFFQAPLALLPSQRRTHQLSPLPLLQLRLQGIALTDAFFIFFTSSGFPFEVKVDDGSSEKPTTQPPSQQEVCLQRLQLQEASGALTDLRKLPEGQGRLGAEFRQRPECSSCQSN